MENADHDKNASKKRPTIQDDPDHKQAEAILNKPQSTSETVLLEAASKILIKLTREGEVIEYQSPTRDLPPEKIIGKKISEVMPIEFAETLLQHTKTALDTGTVQTLEYLVPTPKGVKFYEAQLFTDHSNVIAIVGDLTEKKELEQKNALLSTIFNYSDDAIFTKTLDGLILSWNAGAEKIHGYSANEIVGRNISILLPPNHENEMIEFMKIIKKGESVDHYITKRLRKDGKVIDVSVTLSPIKNLFGAITGASTIVRDVTAEKKYYEDFNRLFNLSSDMLCMADLDGYFKRLNPAWNKILGYTNEELLAKPFIEFVHTDDKAATIAIVQKLSHGVSAVSFPNRCSCKDGSYKWLEWNIASIPEEGLLYAVVRDISERKKVDEDRVQLQKERQRFISAATHELKTPLAVIKGYADLLDSNIQDESRLEKKYSKIILRNADRMLNLLEEMLNIQTIENGMVHLHVEPVDIVEVITRVVEDMKPIINAKKIRVEVKLPQIEIVVPGDRARLQEVVENLLSNAIKYTPANGGINIAAMSDNDTLLVKFSDTGIGIDEAYLPHVFDPFSNIPKSRATGDYGGFKIFETGLGLNVSKTLIGLHGGKIWAESPGEGRGSTFTFTLPRRN